MASRAQMDSENILVTADRADERSSRRSWSSVLLWVGLALLGLPILAAVIFTSTYQIVYQDRIFFGVKVLQDDVGGLTKAEARRVIDARLKDYLDSAITLQYEGRTWQTTPREMGADFDAEQALAQVFAVGRGGNLLDQLLAQWTSYREGVSVRPFIVVDQAKQRAALASLARDVDKPAVDARLTLEGTTVRLAPGRAGLALDGPALSTSLTVAFDTLSRFSLGLPVKTVPPAVSDADLQSLKARLETMVGSPVAIRFVGQDTVWQNGAVQKRVEKNWSLSTQQIAELLSLVTTKDAAGKTVTDVTIDEEKLGTYSTKWAAEVDRKPANARFDLQAGQLVPIRDSVDGRTTDVPKAVSLLVEKIRATENRTVDLPVKIEKPAVSVADMSRIVVKDKISERSTSYAGSVPERAHNVRWGASRLHGVVVAPGQEFSFLEEEGDITYAAGFQTGFAIVGANTVPDPGGGICQVSTTLFQAVFYGGYEILERYPHAYRMVRYEPPAGLDATIYEGQLDFRFRNNSDNYLLIQSRSDESRVYFSLYGIAPGWQVSVEGPYITNIVEADRTLITRETSALAKGRTVQVEEPQDGADVTIKRKVVQDGKVITSDTFFSRYRPEGNVVLVGTG